MALVLSSILVGASLAAVVKGTNFPLPTDYHRYTARSKDINWGVCADSPDSGRECARFEVPLDWHNTAAGKASLAVVRYKAVNEPKLGTLFTNPGGPGGSGVGFILGNHGSRLMTASGGKYDIVSWDPRGVGETVPRADCFKTITEEVSYWEGSIGISGLEVHGNFTDKRDLDAFYEQANIMDTLLKELGRRCLEYSPDTFQYIGTAAVVRDMIALHDVLEGSDKPLNFWGVSYGTVVGSYFINMFPDRVGQVVLDGVVDPVYWANRPAHLLWDVSVASSEDTFDGFCNACALAGPSECAIAKQNSTAASIRQWTQELLDKAYHHKRQFGSAAQVTSARIRNRLFGAMYSPSSWPSIAEVLASYSDLLSNTTISTKARRTEERIIFPGRNTNSTENDTTVDDPAFDYSFQGITCADAIDTVNVTTKDVFDMILSTARNVSPTFGPLWGDAGFFCHHWPVRAVERYTGPWNKTLSSTIIVIGNEADPITPLISAKKLADALGDSAVLIEQDDYGHSSLAMHSNCTVAALQNYFVHNKLPTQDIFCGTNQVLFPAAGGDVTKKTVDRAKAASKVEARRPS